MEGSWPETDSARKMLSVKKNPGSGLSFKFFCRSKSIRLGSIPDVDNPLRFRLCSCFPGYRDHSGTESQKDSTIRLDFRPHVQSPLLYGWTVMELCIPPLEEKTERPSKGPDQPKTKEETVDRRKGQKSTIAYAEQGALGETSGTKEAPEEENDARVPEHLLFLVEGTRELCLTPAHTKEAGDEPVKKERQEVRQTILGTEEAPQVIAIGAGWRGELLEQAKIEKDKGSGLLCHQGRLLGHKAVKDYERTREGDLGNDDACERSQIQAVGPVDPEQIGVDLVAFAVDSNPDVDPTQLTGDSRSTRRNTSRGRSEQAGTGGRNGIRSGPGAMDPLDGESPMLHSLGSTTTGLYLSIPMVWEEGQIDLNQKADHLVPPLNHHSPKGKELISDLSLPNSRRGYSPFSSLAGWRSMNEATEGISHYVELLTAVANLLGLRQLLYFFSKKRGKQPDARSRLRLLYSRDTNVSRTYFNRGLCTPIVEKAGGEWEIDGFFLKKKFIEGIAMRACLRSSPAVALQSGWNVERLGQGAGGIVISSTRRTTEPLPLEEWTSETHIQRQDRKKAPIKGEMSSRSPIKRLNVKLLYVSCAMRGGWHRQSMQGGLAAYGFIGNQGAQGLRAEHPWKGPRLSTKKPKAAGSARAYSLESPNRSGFRKGVESRPAEAYQVDASSLDPGEEETQGLVALVKGRMERMASLPFDGSRRGIHFEGSMLLESCCTGASLAR
ncbi:hypothetical protein Acr_00g0001480 [Actinidia rufa]|uniref:Uncharacterized protein n=1 Tax=Actinidia rufa TaxID=165716 RepID=A0A7J0D6K4_9ERIC|nr:hypothetical protein Acr_00g0001480 [Actinidia rufa]